MEKNGVHPTNHRHSRTWAYCVQISFPPNSLYILSSSTYLTIGLSFELNIIQLLKQLKIYSSFVLVLAISTCSSENKGSLPFQMKAMRQVVGVGFSFGESIVSWKKENYEYDHPDSKLGRLTFLAYIWYTTSFSPEEAQSFSFIQQTFTEHLLCSNPWNRLEIYLWKLPTFPALPELLPFLSQAPYTSTIC